MFGGFRCPHVEEDAMLTHSMFRRTAPAKAKTVKRVVSGRGEKIACNRNYSTHLSIYLYMVQNKCMSEVLSDMHFSGMVHR